MMEKKRTRAWRRHQARRVFTSRVKNLAAWMSEPETTWMDLKKEKWVQVYRTTGTPCSCWMCRGESFDRNSFKRETADLVKSALMEEFI